MLSTGNHEYYWLFKGYSSIYLGKNDNSVLILEYHRNISRAQLGHSKGKCCMVEMGLKDITFSAEKSSGCNPHKWL